MTRDKSCWICILGDVLLFWFLLSLYWNVSRVLILVTFLCLYLQLRWQRGDQCWSETVLLQSWSQRHTGLSSYPSLKLLCGDIIRQPFHVKLLNANLKTQNSVKYKENLVIIGLSVSLLLQLHGMMRVILEPLIGDVPIVGAVSMFFIRRPVGQFIFTIHLH